MIMSVGALAEDSFLAELLELARIRKGRSRIYVPTGAIAGIDAIRSVRHLQIPLALLRRKVQRPLLELLSLRQQASNLIL